jgi:site-specific recombinase XerD
MSERLASSVGKTRPYSVTFEVSDELLEEVSRGEWSAPVQFRFEQRDTGEWDLVFRTWDYRGPRLIVRPMLTTDQATDLFLGDLTRRGYSKRTVDTYRRILDKLCDRLPDDLDVAKITIDDCRRFLDLWNGKAAGTRAHVFSVISSFFVWLYKTEKIKRNPIDRLDGRAGCPPRTSTSRRLVGRRAGAAQGARYSTRRPSRRASLGRTPSRSPIVAYMGPRRRAAALLRLTDYDRDRQRIKFHEKGGKVIWKPVPHELARLIDQAIADGAIVKPDGYLIPANAALRATGERDDRVVWRLVKDVAKQAGVNAHVHSLRAAFAVFYLEQNPGNIESLKELMGHRSLTTTQIYLRKLNRGTAMERVRDLNWNPSSSATSSSSPLARDAARSSPTAASARRRCSSNGRGSSPSTPAATS